MKLGAFSALFGDKNLDETCKYFSSLGLQAIELGSGGVCGKDHCNPEELLNDKSKFNAFKETFKKYDLEISAFSVHGNPVHPDKDKAEAYNKDFKDTILLAEKLGISRVMNFSGCPGDCPNSKYPNWVIQPWPDDFLTVLDYQWNEVLFPFWSKWAKFAKDHGVNKICIEPHPGFAVYNPETMLKLRNEIGEVIGCNFDPSHFFWQGINPSAAIRKLGPAIYNFHAKDSSEDMLNISVNGRLDAKPYTDEINRAWFFRVLGYGHDDVVWKDMISNLIMVGYDDVISIEHEDSLMTAKEGFEKAVEFLKRIIVFERSKGTWWCNKEDV
jgi:sugar phosphate isomerase/epimerase